MTGPDGVPNPIRPTPPGVISFQHSAVVSFEMVPDSAPGGRTALPPSSALGEVRSAAASRRSTSPSGLAG
jgi:hypothetical protein